jgi:hypothetical protein
MIGLARLAPRPIESHFWRSDMNESESARPDGDAPKANSYSVVKIGVGFFLALILLIALNMN